MNKKRLKIALFNSNADTIPPKNKIVNAPRWLVYYLANGLVERGHKVFLYTVPGSKSRAEIISDELTHWSKIKYIKELIRKGLRDERVRRFVMNDQTTLAGIYKEKEFDIIHTHTELSLPLAALVKHTPTLITFHSPYDQHYRELFYHYKKVFPQIFINSLSQAHANQAPKVSFDFIVYNGIDTDNFVFNKQPKDYLLFSGRINLDKGADIAIQVAKKTNKPLKLIGQKFYSNDNNIKFWDTKIAPYLNNKIKYLGFIPYEEVKKYYQNAKALLFLNRWKEAFGLVMIEAMACGTPVIAIPRGAVPEVVKDGVTGFMVKNEKEAVKAVKKIYTMPKDEYTQMRYNCRKHVEKNFTIERMVDNYEKVYYEIIKKFKKSEREDARI